MRISFLLVVSLGFSLACMGFNPLAPKPAAIAFEAVPETIFDSSAVDLQLRVEDAAHKAIPNLAVQAVATPAEIAVVTSTGELRCIGSGDAIVNLSYQELRNAISVKCRLVASLGLSKEMRLELGKVIPLDAKPVDATGKPVADVDLRLGTADEAILKVGKGNLVPQALGVTKLYVEGAGQKLEIPVTVVRQFITESLALHDGEGMTWAVPPGNYEIKVQVKASDASTNGVILTWVNNECPALEEGQELHQICNLPNAASLIVTNPTHFSLGPQVVGLINVVQVP